MTFLEEGVGEQFQLMYRSLDIYSQIFFSYFEDVLN